MEYSPFNTFFLCQLNKEILSTKNVKILLLWYFDFEMSFETRILGYETTYEKNMGSLINDGF